MEAPIPEQRDLVAPTLQGTGRTGLLLGVLALAALLFSIGAYLYFAGSDTNTALEPRRTIGIVYFRQQTDNVAGFKDGMRELGYTNVAYIEELVAVGPMLTGDMDTAIRRLIAADVDLLWMASEIQAKAALGVTSELGSDIPVVYMTMFHQPVEYGLASTFVSSKNNGTGVAADIAEIVQKTAAFLREMQPEANAIGIFGSGFMIPDFAAAYLSEWQRQAPRYGFDIVEYKTDATPERAEAAWHTLSATIKKGDIDAIVHVPGHYFDKQEYAEYEMAVRFGIPHAVPVQDFPGGGHFAYSADFNVAGAQTAVMVDKIFKGLKPADIPLEYGAKNSLFLHKERAQKTGLTFPASMLEIAEELPGS